MKKCSFCNNINGLDAKFCVNCGNNLKINNNSYKGSVVKFGKYYKFRDYVKEPINWLVLEISNNKALLISRDAIECKPYHEKYEDITWEQCSLRKWLNIEFLNQAFSKEEQNKILLTNVLNQESTSYGINGGNNTQDKIFLLSIKEFQKYFNDENRACVPTSYLIPKGVWTFKGEYYYVEDKFYGNCIWWLRSPGDNQRGASVVSYSGKHSVHSKVDSNDIAVRPALYINL